MKKKDRQNFYAFVRTQLANLSESYRWERFEWGDIKETFVIDTPDGKLHCTISPLEKSELLSVFFRFDGPRHKVNFHIFADKTVEHSTFLFSEHLRLLVGKPTAL